MVDSRPVGVFDSGVGGLTVLDAIHDLLPKESLIYLGDTARVPYGNKSPSTVKRYALGCSRFLVERGIKALVIACNTASAFGVSAVREAFNIPVLGVIEPVAREASQETKSRCVGVIGTRGTVSSGAYRRALALSSSALKVQEEACPLLVPLAEEGWIDDPVTEQVVARYLEPFKSSETDTLILGCTHYPVLKDAIGRQLSQVMGRAVTLCDSASATARALESLLKERALLSSGGEAGEVSFFVSDEPERFASVGARFMRFPPSQVSHVDL